VVHDLLNQVKTKEEESCKLCELEGVQHGRCGECKKMARDAALRYFTQSPDKAAERLRAAEVCTMAQTDNADFIAIGTTPFQVHLRTTCHEAGGIRCEKCISDLTSAWKSVPATLKVPFWLGQYKSL
jgi:hypothetical protein